MCTDTPRWTRCYSETSFYEGYSLGRLLTLIRLTKLFKSPNHLVGLVISMSTADERTSMLRSGSELRADLLELSIAIIVSPKNTELRMPPSR